MGNVFVTSEELHKLISEIISEEFSKQPVFKTNSDKVIYTIEEAAKFLCLSKHTVRKYVKLGKLKPVLTLIKGYRFHRNELERFSNDYRNY